MASIQEPCLVRIYKKSPTGHKTLVLQQRVEQLAPAGGAPDAAPASVSTPEKLLTVNSPVVFKNDDIVEVTVTLDASDGLDVSDAIWSIPLLTPAGNISLGQSAFQNPAAADITPPAGKEIVFSGYRITEGEARLAGKIYLDVQDDTA